LKLARLATDPDARDEHLQAAREAWMKVDRVDLIQQLEEEFNAMENE
jgi:hypothetical protein